MNWFHLARKLVIVLAVIISSRTPSICPEVEIPESPKLIISKVLIFLLDIRISQLNTLKLKITKGLLLLNLNQLILTTTCLLYVQANSIDQVIGINIQEKYYGLAYVSTPNVSHGAETCVSFTWPLAQMLTFIGT